MDRAFGIILVLLLAGCGVDSPPVPPGQDNPETRQSVEEFQGLTPEAYF